LLSSESTHKSPAATAVGAEVDINVWFFKSTTEVRLVINVALAESAFALVVASVAIAA
jgi:hypothetical protein